MKGYTEYVPNPRIVDRAVALWMTMLQKPKYDNLGENSPEPAESIHANTMASVLAHALPRNNTPDVLIRFGEELRKVLMAPFEWKAQSGEKYTSLFRCLSVDYGPDIPLATAAERAGLKMEFPWKTSMYLGTDYLSLGYGYGAPMVYHYSLSNDRWLVTQLCGDDIEKIKALVEAGTITTDLTAP